MPSGSFAVSNNSLGLNTWVNWSSSDDPVNNRSWVVGQLWARRNSSTTFGSGTWTVWIDGVPQSWSGSKSIGTSDTLIISVGLWVGHNSDGSRNVGISVGGGIPGTSWTSTSGGQTVGLTNYVRLPGAPSNLRVRASTITTDSFGVDYDRNPNGTSLSRADHVEWSRADTGVVVWNDNGASGYSSPNGGATAGAPKLLPGVEYRVRARSATVDGFGPFSGYLFQKTLSAAYVGKGGGFPPASAVLVGKGNAFPAAAEIRVGEGGIFVQPS